MCQVRLKAWHAKTCAANVRPKGCHVCLRFCTGSLRCLGQQRRPLHSEPADKGMCSIAFPASTMSAEQQDQEVGSGCLRVLSAR